MPCRTKPETISTDKQRPYGCPRRCSLTPMTIPVMKQQSTHHNNYYRCTWHLVLNCTILYWSPLYTKENRVKSTNVCVYKHKPYVLGTTYVSVHKNNSNRGAADPYASRRQRKNSSVHDGECTYGLSDWFTIPQNQVKVESLTEHIVDKAKYAHPGLFEPRPSTASVWPTAGLLACDLCVFLNVADFGPNVARYTWSWLTPPQASIIPGTWYLVPGTWDETKHYFCRPWRIELVQNLAPQPFYFLTNTTYYFSIRPYSSRRTQPTTNTDACTGEPSTRDRGGVTTSRTDRARR